MAIEVLVPPLGESASGAKLATWLKQEGDAVAAGETIAEIETDKTIVEVVAPAAGTLQKIDVPVGAGDLVDGRVIAVIETGAAAPAKALAAVLIPAPERPHASDPPLRQPRSTTKFQPPTTNLIPATPLAQRMAAVLDLDLSDVQGTGAGGKINKADIERFAGRVPRSPSTQEADPAAAGAYEERALSPMRKITAARMLQAKQTIPHFYLSAECRVDALIDAQARLNAADPQTRLTLTDFVIRAVALAMREVPDANAAWADGAVHVYERVDVAVAVNTPRGLITPVLRDAASKPLHQIAAEFRTLTARARDGALTPPEYTGGTVTISNLGMFGIDSLFAILNPPQSCIIGIGAVEEKPVVRGGQIAIGSVMTATLSADHRVLDGATGAMVLRALKQLVQDPVRIVG